MKKFLVAFVAVFAMNPTLQANEGMQSQIQDELMPADQLTELDGVDPALAEELGLGLEQEDSFDYPRPHRPRPPRPRPPRPRPPRPPRPVPPPPHYRWYECSAQDQYGRYYHARGRHPGQTQWAAKDACERHSGTYCYEMGCRRI